jgi:hypothetical protein
MGLPNNYENVLGWDVFIWRKHWRYFNHIPDVNSDLETYNIVVYGDGRRYLINLIK